MVQDIDPRLAAELLAGPDGYVYLDVRTVGEFDQGHVPGAVNVPVVEPHLASGKLVPNSRFLGVVQGRYARDQRMIVGCKSGGRSAAAATILSEAGFVHVANMRGGFFGLCDATGKLVESGWATLGLPVGRDDDEAVCYSSLLK